MLVHPTAPAPAVMASTPWSAPPALLSPETAQAILKTDRPPAEQVFANDVIRPRIFGVCSPGTKLAILQLAQRFKAEFERAIWATVEIEACTWMWDGSENEVSSAGQESGAMSEQGRRMWRVQPMRGVAWLTFSLR